MNPYKKPLSQKLIELHKLTPLEAETAVLVGKGYTNREIGKLLNTITTTIDWRVGRVLKKLKLTRNRMIVYLYCLDHDKKVEDLNA